MENTYETKQETTKLPRSNIESIDGALFKYVDEELNLHCTTADGFKKVPVIWSNSERAFQIKNNVQIRDNNGTLIPPIISINRKSISKNPAEKGTFQANLAPNHNRIIYERDLNQDKTSNFANADTKKRVGQLNFITSKKNKKQVLKFKSVLMPVYVMIEYEIQILTNYLQQMNELTQPFMTKTAALNYFVIKHESFRYECFIQQDFSQESSDLGEEEKKHKSTVTIKVLGQLVGDDVNQDIPTEIVEENAVEIKFPRETNIIVSDEDTRKKNVNSNKGNSSSETIVYGRVIKKTFLVGDGINSTYNIAHNMNTRDMYVSVRETSGDYGMVFVGISFPTLNTMNVNFGEVIDTDSHSVTIVT